jgi:2-octaprenyl-6-methoxyphenol hydroxylase
MQCGKKRCRNSSINASLVGQEVVRKFDCVIVGGGMVGASLALALGRLNYQILLVEQQLGKTPTCDENARTIALTMSSVAIYQQLQVWPQLAKQAVAIQEVLVTVQKQFGSCRLKATDQQVDALGYVLAVHEVEAALYSALQELPNVTLARGWQLQAQQQHASTWWLTIANVEQTEQIETNLLVAADGAGSALARMRAINFEKIHYDHQAIMVNLQFNSKQPGLAIERFLANGAIAVLPWRNGLATCVWTIKDPQAIMAMSDEEFIAACQAQLGARSGLVKAVGRRHCLPLNMQLANLQVAHRCVLMGNAAHSLHPIAAQGLNLSLRDIWQFCSLLPDQVDLGEAAFLEKYLQQRRTDQSRVIFATDKIARFMTKGPLPTWVRAMGITLFDSLTPIKQRFTQLSMGV